MNWESIVQRASPYVVKIETPSGHGTGFLFGYNEDNSLCCLATALHVVRDADEWQQPIRIHNHNFQKRIFVKESQRVIFPDYNTDSAVIFLPSMELDLPKTLIPLRPRDVQISIGVEVGWLGYPGLEPLTLCFFSGSISARREDRSAYLIDGVAINGVSGGPVFCQNSTGEVQFIGVVSAYRANRQRGDTLPGLLVAQDVSHFHAVIQKIKSIDEAKKQKPEIEATKAQEQSSDNPKLT